MAAEGDHDAWRRPEAATALTPLLSQSAQRKLNPKPWFAKLNDSFENWFAWEISSAVVAVLSFVAIVIILILFDGSALPDWPSIFTVCLIICFPLQLSAHGWQINSIISFLSSLSQISFMVIVGSSISQSKWLWYRQRDPKISSVRPLAAIQDFDDASRGPWGAFNFLFKYRFSTLASLGAVVVILSLLFGPFVQQLVNYQDKLVAAQDEQASIVRAQRYLSSSFEDLPLPSVVDLSMKAAIYGGVFDARNQANARTEYQCSTGNCTFDHFSSLAICDSCVNITKQISTSCDTLPCETHYLPGGLSISTRGDQINTSISNISSELSSVEASVVQFTTLFSKQATTYGQARAWECSMFYCVNEYVASAEGGQLDQNVVKTWRNDSASLSLDENLVFDPPNSAIDITANVSSFYVDIKAAKALSEFMSSSFTGHGTIKDNKTDSLFSSDIVHALFEADDLPNRIGNLAMAMSNNIRQQNYSGSHPFQGTALKGQTLLEVRWAWIAYPAVILTISLCCLFSMIVETQLRKVSVWKTSQTALFFLGVRLKAQPEVPVGNLGEITEHANLVHVSLNRDKDGQWAFQENTSPADTSAA